MFGLFDRPKINVKEIGEIHFIETPQETERMFFSPKNFDEYIGQKKVKGILIRYIENINKRNLPFPHTLIHSKPGMGKTTLARIISEMLGKEMEEIISSSLPKQNKNQNILQEKIKNLNGKILFIDEIHSLPRDEVEKIYSMMESFSYNGVEIEPFTLIGATTELGEIIKSKKPFYDRFKLLLELSNYTIPELITISKQYRKEIFPDDEINPKHYTKIAENGRDTPRIVIRLTESTVYFDDDIDEMFKSFDIIYKGYTQKDLKLLEYLSKNKVVGLQGIAAFLDTSKENYLYEIEPYLIKNGIVVRTPRGRGISDYGLSLLRTLKRKTTNGKHISFNIINIKKDL